MQHVTLNAGERAEVVVFWRDFFLSGGEGPEPSALQMDALNDPMLRDALLFWTVGGSPDESEKTSWPEMEAYYEALGPVPEDFDMVLSGLLKVFENFDLDLIQMEDIDTAGVLMCFYAQWALIVGEYEDVKNNMAKLIATALKRQIQTGDKFPHADPVIAFGTLATGLIHVLEEQGQDEAERVVKSVFGMTELPRVTRGTIKKGN